MNSGEHNLDSSAPQGAEFESATNWDELQSTALDNATNWESLKDVPSPLSPKGFNGGNEKPAEPANVPAESFAAEQATVVDVEQPGVEAAASTTVEEAIGSVPQPAETESNIPGFLKNWFQSRQKLKEADPAELKEQFQQKTRDYRKLKTLEKKVQEPARQEAVNQYEIATGDVAAEKDLYDALSEQLERLPANDYGEARQKILSRMEWASKRVEAAEHALQEANETLARVTKDLMATQETEESLYREGKQIWRGIKQNETQERRAAVRDLSDTIRQLPDEALKEIQRLAQEKLEASNRQGSQARGRAFAANPA